MSKFRTSLEVGFPEAKLPEDFLIYRAEHTRQIAVQSAFPFEDEQFEVVLLDASAFAPNIVQEVHRVLKKEGLLVFRLPEKTSKQAGYVLSDVYAVLRAGFDITSLTRPRGWFFRRTGRTFTIVASKKNWRKTPWRSFRPSYLQH